MKDYFPEVLKLLAENAKLKANVNAYRDAYLEAKRHKKRADKAEKVIRELAGQLAAANLNLLPKYNQTGPVVGPVSVELKRTHCDNGITKKSKRPKHARR